MKKQRTSTKKKSVASSTTATTTTTSSTATDIEGAKLLHKKGIKLYEDGNHQEAIRTLGAALKLVINELGLVLDPEAKQLACSIRCAIVDIMSCSAAGGDRSLHTGELDCIIGLLNKNARDASSVVECAQYHEKAAMYCLERIENANTSGSVLKNTKQMFNQSTEYVMGLTGEEVEEYQQKCSKYAGELNVIMVEASLRKDNSELDGEMNEEEDVDEDTKMPSTNNTIPDVKQTNKHGELSFLHNEYLMGDKLIGICKRLLKDGNLNNRARKATIDMYDLLKEVEQKGKGFNKATFKKKEKAIFKEWKAAMDKTSFRGRAHSSNEISDDTELCYILNWTTPDCLENTPGQDDHCWEKNGVMGTAKISLPSSLNNEAGAGRLDDQKKEKLKKSISISDLHTAVPKTKDNHDADFNQCPREMGISREIYELFGALRIAARACYYFLVHGKPMPTICGSAPVYEIYFGKCGRARAGKILFCGYMAHPECYCSGWLANVLVFTFEKLTEFDKTAVLGFKHVKAISVPSKSSMSFRFAKHKEKTEEELLLQAEARQADCVRGGRNAQKIRKELNGLTQKLVTAKSQSAKLKAQSKLIKALKVNSISNKKRRKSLSAGLLGLLAHNNKLDSDLVHSLSIDLDVVPIIPKMTYGLGRKQHLTNATGRKRQKTYGDGREQHPTYETGREQHSTYENGRAPHLTNATGRKRQKQSINSVTLKPGAKKKEDGRQPGSGRNANTDKLEIALQAKLDYPNLTVLQALRKGGFVFNVTDSKLPSKSKVIEETSGRTYNRLYNNFYDMKSRRQKEENAK